MLSQSAADELKPFLESLIRECDPDEVDNDPVGLVRDYDAIEDRELVALLASGLAYGQVSQIRRSVRAALAPFGSQPSRKLASLEPDEIKTLLDGWYYRMTRAADLVDLFVSITAVRKSFGSLEKAYLASTGTHVERASAWVGLLRSHRHHHELSRGFRYLIADPGLGGVTKRLHLFFRWMVRPDDGVDLGLWADVPTDVLVMPLDTHTARICRYLGLTARKTNDLKSAVEITESLKLLDPIDPLRFDFAICHLGISKGCVHKRTVEHCPSCPINDVCTLAWSIG